MYQIGLFVLPLLNNLLFRKLNRNPFPNFFKRGLNVTLSTVDLLLFHMSGDALLKGMIAPSLHALIVQLIHQNSITVGPSTCPV